jgi:hypothetical protein
MPMQRPAASPEIPQHKPAHKCANPVYVEYAFSLSFDGFVIDCPIMTPTMRP